MAKHRVFKEARSLQEVADITGLSVKIVEQTLFRAKKKMRAKAERLGLNPEDVIDGSR